jgi:hypothetical protein
MEKRDSLPDAPQRRQFDSDESFEEARGRWQESIGRIRGLVDRARRTGVWADLPTSHSSPEDLAQHRKQVKRAMQQDYIPSNAELQEMAAMLAPCREGKQGGHSSVGTTFWLMVVCATLSGLYWTGLVEQPFLVAFEYPAAVFGIAWISARYFDDLSI